MSGNVERVREWFGLGQEARSGWEAAGVGVPGAGRIMLITGASGSGKTRLLRALQKRATRGARGARVRWVELDEIELPERAVVDCFEGAELTAALRLLSRCGLGEAWTYLKRPAELSEGQRWRLRLALGLRRVQDAGAGEGAEGQRSVLVADEFCAVLDRVTACVVARSVRRIVDGMGDVALICATSHDDLQEALRPDVSVVCDFGRVVAHNCARLRTKKKA